MRPSAPPSLDADDLPDEYDWPLPIAVDPDDVPTDCEGGAIAVLATVILAGLAVLGLLTVVSWVASLMAGAAT